MNTINVKVSIVVAVYKSARFLDKLVLSILSQTHRDLEIILVDDGSPDESGAICDKYAQQDSRITVIHKNNGGACDARNKGLAVVTGEYVSIIDGDDWLSPDYIEYLLNLAVEYDADMSMTCNIFTTRDQVQVPKDQIEVVTPVEATARIIYPTIPIGPWNKLYRVSLIKDNKIGFDTPWSGEGLYFSAMAAQHSNRVVIGKRKIYNYRMNNEESGLTNYNVVMGTNALWNIKNISKSLIHTNKRLEDALQWHIWKNNVFLLKLIVATNQEDKYKSEYQSCIEYIKNNSFAILQQNEFGLRYKFKVLKIWLSPVEYVKEVIIKERLALQQDKMK